jgi:hypothetical protein
MTERHGAAHRITQTRPGSGNSTDVPRSTRPIEKWKGTGVWNVTQPGLGQLDTVASDPNEYGEHGLTSWKNERGYTARVEHLDPVSGGWERQTHQAGPFKTPLRSQIAAESLSRRITKRGSPEHHVGTTFDSYEDMMPEGASMRRRY